MSNSHQMNLESATTSVDCHVRNVENNNDKHTIGAPVCDENPIISNNSNNANTNSSSGDYDSSSTSMPFYPHQRQRSFSDTTNIFLPSSESNFESHHHPSSTLNTANALAAAHLHPTHSSTMTTVTRHLEWNTNRHDENDGTNRNSSVNFTTNRRRAFSQNEVRVIRPSRRSLIGSSFDDNNHYNPNNHHRPYDLHHHPTDSFGDSSIRNSTIMDENTKDAKDEHCEIPKNTGLKILPSRLCVRQYSPTRDIMVESTTTIQSPQAATFDHHNYHHDYHHPSTNNNGSMRKNKYSQNLTSNNYHHHQHHPTSPSLVLSSTNDSSSCIINSTTSRRRVKSNNSDNKSSSSNSNIVTNNDNSNNHHHHHHPHFMDYPQARSIHQSHGITSNRHTKNYHLPPPLIPSSSSSSSSTTNISTTNSLSSLTNMIRKKTKYPTKSTKKILMIRRLLAMTFAILCMYTYSTTTIYSNDMDSINDQLRFESSKLSTSSLPSSKSAKNNRENDHTTTTTKENVLLLQMKMANHPGESIVLRGNQDHVISSAILSSSSTIETDDTKDKQVNEDGVSNSQIQSIVTDKNKSNQIQFTQPLSSATTSTKKVRQPKLAQANTLSSIYNTNKNDNNNNNIPQPKIKEFTLTEDDIKKIDSVLSHGGHRIGGLKPIWYFIALGFISLIVIVIEGVLRDDRRRRRLLEP